MVNQWRIKSVKMKVFVNLENELNMQFQSLPLPDSILPVLNIIHDRLILCISLSSLNSEKNI